MTKHELSKAYDFKATESRIYSMWEKGGYFKPWNDPNKAGFDPAIKPFVLTIPPPNVTGELHLGHAMFVSMEDLMVRYHRMKKRLTQKQAAKKMGFKNLYSYQRLEKKCNATLEMIAKIKGLFPDFSIDFAFA